MQLKKNHGRLYYKIFTLICFMLIASISIFCLFEFKARDLLHNLVDNELEIKAMNSIDSAVSEVLGIIPIEYSNLIVTNTDSAGKVNSLHTNSKAINILKSELSIKITEKIREDQKIKVGVPAGAFTGVVLLSELGPDIFVTLRLGGSVTTTIKSEFSSAGINQTLHRIYLIVDADVSLTCPIIFYETSFTTEYELCQTVIVGTTPQTFADIR